MKMFLLKESVIEVSKKVITAFYSWGIGVSLMLLYSLFILWLNKFNKFIFIAGALGFLVLAFFVVDIWWYYRRMNRLQKLRKRS